MDKNYDYYLFDDLSNDKEIIITDKAILIFEEIILRAIKKVNNKKDEKKDIPEFMRHLKLRRHISEKMQFYLNNPKQTSQKPSQKTISNNVEKQKELENSIRIEEEIQKKIIEEIKELAEANGQEFHEDDLLVNDNDQILSNLLKGQHQKQFHIKNKNQINKNKNIPRVEAKFEKNGIQQNQNSMQKHKTYASGLKVNNKKRELKNIQTQSAQVKLRRKSCCCSKCGSQGQFQKKHNLEIIEKEELILYPSKNSRKPSEDQSFAHKYIQSNVVHNQQKHHTETQFQHEQKCFNTPQKQFRVKQLTERISSHQSSDLRKLIQKEEQQDKSLVRENSENSYREQNQSGEIKRNESIRHSFEQEIHQKNQIKSFEPIMTQHQLQNAQNHNQSPFQNNLKQNDFQQKYEQKQSEIINEELNTVLENLQKRSVRKISDNHLVQSQNHCNLSSPVKPQTSLCKTRQQKVFLEKEELLKQKERQIENHIQQQQLKTTVGSMIETKNLNMITHHEKNKSLQHSNQANFQLTSSTAFSRSNKIVLSHNQNEMDSLNHIKKQYLNSQQHESPQQPKLKHLKKKSLSMKRLNNYETIKHVYQTLQFHKPQQTIHHPIQNQTKQLFNQIQAKQSQQQHSQEIHEHKFTYQDDGIAKNKTSRPDFQLNINLPAIKNTKKEQFSTPQLTKNSHHKKIFTMDNEFHNKNKGGSKSKECPEIYQNLHNNIQSKFQINPQTTMNFHATNFDNFNKLKQHSKI